MYFKVSSIPSTGDGYGSNSNSLLKTPQRMEDVQQHLSQPSPTVNTREAQMLMQEMWGCQYQSGSTLKKEAVKGEK